MIEDESGMQFVECTRKRCPAFQDSGLCTAVECTKCIPPKSEQQALAPVESQSHGSIFIKTQTFCLGCGEHINSHVHDEPKDDGPRKGQRAGSVSRVSKIEDKELSRKIAEMFKDAEEALRFAVEKREEEQRREMLPWNLPQDRI